MLNDLNGGRSQFPEFQSQPEIEKKNKSQFNEAIIFLVAHELRNPIGIIKGYSQLVKNQLSRLAGTEPQRQTLDLVIEQTLKMNRLIEDLLDITQIEAGNFQLSFLPCNLAEIARRTIDGFQLNSPEIEFILELKNGDDTGQYAGLYDVDRLDQVITNLISNAVKYSLGEGCITLTLQLHTVQESKLFIHSSSEFDGYLAGKKFKQSDKIFHFSISDKGIGIPLDQQPELFKYLFRSTNSRAQKIGGLGLGLFISRQIITGHGGVIWVESPGENLGTTVHFVLPA